MLLIVEPTGLAGKFLLGASVDLPGVVISGKLEALINTFGVDKSFMQSSLLAQVVGADPITIPGKLPLLNPAFDSSNLNSPILVPDTSTGAGTPCFVIAGRADLRVLNTLTLAGAFRIAASPEKVEVQAAISVDVTLPGQSSPLFRLNGAAAFGIDLAGIYGRAELSRQGGTPPTALAPGFTFDTQFVLEFNTASASRTIQSFTFDPTTGGKLSVANVTLAGGTLRLLAGGTLSFNLTGGEAFTLTGRFEMTLTATALQIEAAVRASGPGVNGDASGGLRLSTTGLAGFIAINVSAGVGNAITGTGFELNFNLSLQVNTTNAPVPFSGVTLEANKVVLKASGFLQVSLGGVAGFRIEGSLLVSADGTGFTVAVNGVLTAHVVCVQLIKLNVDGGLQVRNAGTAANPVYQLAARLNLSIASDSKLYGAGFAFTATLKLEINTTGAAVDLNADGARCRTALGSTGASLVGI